MDLVKQNELAAKIDKILITDLQGRDYHAIIAVEGRGDKFTFSLTSLDERTSFRSCRIIVSGITEESKLLTEQFKIPSDEKFKRPIEPK